MEIVILNKQNIKNSHISRLEVPHGFKPNNLDILCTIWLREMCFCI